MSSHEEMERIPGKHGYFIVYKIDGGLFGSSKYFVKKPDGSSSGTFDSFSAAVRYAEEKAGK